MNETPLTQVALALGSNLGDSLDSLCKAAKALAPYVDIIAASGVYETTPAYVADQPLFLNAAIIGKTKLEPLALLWALKDIEAEAGRTPTFRYGPRIIDIDIIFYGDQLVETPELTIPHARVQERDFVLRPLSEIAANWIHPKTGASVAEMLAALPESQMKRLGVSIL